MSYDEQTDQMDWRDELGWILVSLVSGLLLSVLSSFLGKLPDLNLFLTILVFSMGFYILGILLRVQNHRGKLWTGKTTVDENRLKFLFPLVGFAIAAAVFFF